MRRHKFFALGLMMAMLLFGVVGCGRDSNMDETKPPYNDETNKDTNNNDTNNLGDDIKEGIDDAGDAIQDGIDDITNPGNDFRPGTDSTQGTEKPSDLR